MDFRCVMLRFVIDAIIVALLAAEFPVPRIVLLFALPPSHRSGVWQF